MQIRVADPADRERVLPKLRELAQPVSNPILGQTGNADLQITEQPDGTIQLAYTEAGMNERVRRASGQAIEVLRRRVDALGTTEPNIQRQGADRILVQVPGLQDPQRLKDILGRTAKLEFRLGRRTRRPATSTCFRRRTPTASGSRSSAASSSRAAT